MDLLQLGAQARKTGLKPRQNVAKDKYDMEDVDEFFEDTTWADSRRNEESALPVTSKAKKSSVRLEIPTTRKTLGVGRIRNTKISDTKRVDSTEDKDREVELETVNDTLPEQDLILNDLDLSDYQDNDQDFESEEHVDRSPSLEVDQHDDRSQETPSHNTDELVNQESEQIQHKGTPEAHPGDILGDFNDEMTLSPIPLLTLEKRSTESQQRRSPAKPANTNASHFTKTMALARKNIKKRPRIVASDMEDSDAPEPEVSSDGADTFDSDFIESQYSQGSSFKPSQGDAMVQPSPLPSPPPEGLRRSKRTRIAPLAYWRNERIVYSRASESNNGDPDSTLISDIRKVPLQEIHEVVHIPEAKKTKPTPKRGRPPKNSARGRKPKAKPEVYDYESDPEIEGSEWFKSKSLEAEVFESEDSQIKKIVAWSPDGGDFQSPPAGRNGQLGMENFKVAPLFSSDSNTIAAGLLDFPVDGFKSLRTTGESLFIFHVAKGLVEVTLNSDKFVVTRGCSFEVPKLNIYSFKNIGQGSARLFFVQCQIS